MEKIDCSVETLINFLKNSQSIFLTDLIGVRILLKPYFHFLSSILQKETNNEKIISLPLRIIIQIISIIPNFVVAEKSLSNDEQSLCSMISFVDLQSQMTSIFTTHIKSNTENIGLFLWGSALNIIQNVSIPKHSAYFQTLIEGYFVPDVRFRNSRFKKNCWIDDNFRYHRYILSFIELHLEASTTEILDYLMRKLIAVADEKILVDKIQLKKLSIKKAGSLEMIICGIIQLCMSIANLTHKSDNVKKIILYQIDPFY